MNPVVSDAFYFVTDEMLMFMILLISEFAASELVPGFNDGTLQLAFADLRQVFQIKCVYVM